jgi:hypothetical protein
MAFWYDDEGGCIRNYYNNLVIVAVTGGWAVPTWSLGLWDAAQGKTPQAAIGWKPGIEQLIGLDHHHRVVNLGTDRPVVEDFGSVGTRWTRATDQLPNNSWHER